MRRGDFSELLALGDSYRIYDPMTGVAVGQRRQREPFPNNIIPTNRLNPIALAYLKYIRCRTYRARRTGPTTTCPPIPAPTPITASWGGAT